MFCLNELFYLVKLEHIKANISKVNQVKQSSSK